jgi:hypothetical protein
LSRRNQWKRPGHRNVRRASDAPDARSDWRDGGRDPRTLVSHRSGKTFSRPWARQRVIICGVTRPGRPAGQPRSSGPGTEELERARGCGGPLAAIWRRCLPHARAVRSRAARRIAPWVSERAQRAAVALTVDIIPRRPCSLRVSTEGHVSVSKQCSAAAADCSPGPGGDRASVHAKLHASTSGWPLRGGGSGARSGPQA